ncbi:MAG TPA: asparagine synthase (glutamine-hydrolyzing) [Flavisolibacter sp.]|nr:asparagine synthase (glutamine-hydrolyzing) [Flavisolibacter sp.]
MCGIAGIVSHNKGLVSRERITAATNALIHRGPEQEGYYFNEEQTAALGHRRLSIIDLGPEASQPFHYLDRYHIVYNGEIYNYIEIRKQLTDKGIQFHTSSDTEVIVAAFATYGKECVHEFDGAFAFAIWDLKTSELFAARDRFGEKPFFFYYDGEQLAFASEMKALWKMGIGKDVNRTMLYNFLSIDYTTNPGDPAETFYNNIYKLPAASTLHFVLHSKELQTEKYWNVYPNVNEEVKVKDAIDQFTALLTESVRKRLRSDVAIGTSLSGGLDSSSIVSICEALVTNQYTHKCFTASFPGFEKDESYYAQTVASQFGLQQYVSGFDDNEVPGLMDQVMEHQEEPFSSASPLVQYKVYQLAKQQGVTVLLDGQGADEILGGYHKYYKWYWLELFRQGELGTSGEIKAAKALGINETIGIKEKIAAYFPEFALSLLQSKKAKDSWRHADLNEDFAFNNKRNLYYSTPSHFDLNSALYFNTFVQGLEELLRLADRNSMAHSVEVRLPFLSHQLVEFLFTLPSDFKINQGWTKWILRKSVEPRLPAAITWRKDKVGFEPPQQQWMENSAVQAEIRKGKEVLVQEGILKSAVLQKRIQPHGSHVAENREWKYWSAAYLFRN